MSPTGADFPPGVDPRTPAADAEAPAAFETTLRPAVAGASAGAGVWLVGGGSALLGLLAFLWLSSHRTPPSHDLPQPSQVADAAAVSVPPPPPEVEAIQAAARNPAPAAPPPSVAVVTPPPPVTPVIPPGPVVATTPPPAGGRAPVLVVDLANASADSGQAPASTPAGGKPADAARPAAASGLNADEQFAARVETGSEPEHARATRLREPSTTAPQGTIIPAVLETALNSDLPGFARAVVSRDVRSFDGSNVLIPRGSRVIGEYRSAVALGQSRIFVVWTRVLRPDGGSIEISSGGGDTLGRAGLAGKVDRHFFEQFSGAILLTVLNAAAYAAAAGNSSTAVVVNSGSTTGGLGGAGSALTPAAIPPTIKVAQGTPIRIFVQRDLDFTPVGGVGR